MTRKFFGWKINLGSREYKAALDWQLRMVRYREQGMIRDTLFFIEHPEVITVGRDFDRKDMAKIAHPAREKKFKFYRITRGGSVTYHGPGQLVCYPIFDLRRHGRDLHKYIYNLEEGIIRAFADYGLSCERNKNHTGVWIDGRKIASIGIAVKHWISYHGIAVNLNTNLDHFKIIDPCGLSPEVMTTAEKELGKKVSLEEFADNLAIAWQEPFDTEYFNVDLEELAEIAHMEESEQTM